MAKQSDNNDNQSIWAQSTKDIGNADKETLKIYSQLTGDGIVSTEDKKKGNNRRS